MLSISLVAKIISCSGITINISPLCGDDSVRIFQRTNRKRLSRQSPLQTYQLTKQLERAYVAYGSNSPSRRGTQYRAGSLIAHLHPTPNTLNPSSRFL